MLLICGRDYVNLKNKMRGMSTLQNKLKSFGVSAKMMYTITFK